jgi:hypothetical protein
VRIAALTLAAAWAFGACAPAPEPAARSDDGVELVEVYFYKVINISRWRGRYYGVPLPELPAHGRAEAATLARGGYAHCFEGRTVDEVKDAVRRYVLADNPVPDLVWK